MDWFIAIISLINLGLLIAIYRRPVDSNEAAILEAAAQINQASVRLGASRGQVQEATDSVKAIEPEGEQ